jgi:RNA polymerase sigma-70 factor (ECF subfamily)
MQGDTGAFGELVGRHEKTMYNVAFRITGNAEDAADVAQSAFVKAYEKLPSYDPQYRFFSWLFRITTNEALNLSSRRKPNSELDPEEKSLQEEPDANAGQAELEWHVERAMRELTYDYKVVIILKHFLGLPYEEISDMLEIPVKTVKSRLYSARQRLGTSLERRGIKNP